VPRGQHVAVELDREDQVFSGDRRGDEFGNGDRHFAAEQTNRPGRFLGREVDRPALLDELWESHSEHRAG
jgi:hypothetical protein